jgi:3-oxoacyl-[acyl-carrier-protein] synthase II
MRRVVVTGAGVVSSLGDSLDTLHNALCRGHNAIRPLELFPTETLRCPLGGEIKDFDAQKYLGKRDLGQVDRTSLLVVRRKIDPQNGMVNSVGFDGHCCSLILSRVESPG